MTSACQRTQMAPHRGSLVTAESLKLLNPNDHNDNSISQNWVGHLSQSPLGPGSLHWHLSSCLKGVLPPYPSSLSLSSEWASTTETGQSSFPFPDSQDHSPGLGWEQRSRTGLEAAGQETGESAWWRWAWHLEQQAGLKPGWRSWTPGGVRAWERNLWSNLHGGICSLASFMVSDNPFYIERQ